MSYIPKPIDTSDINLPEELLALTERIAENVHDVWAVGRIEQSWSYGLVRNDEKKKRPVLYRTANFQRARRNMTETQQWKH